MDTISSACAAVTGARHARAGRNGQDAAAAWSGEGVGVAVVCDGCSGGVSSEVGARLGAQLVLAIARDELRTTPASQIWPVVRARVVAELRAIATALGGDLERIVHDYLLFTIVAAAWRGDEVAVWAVGDGAYAIGEATRVLGPFADNQPPYAGYDLLDAAPSSHLEVATRTSGAVVVATDGVVEATPSLAELAAPRLRAHPDGLRRRLAVLARGGERIDWDARRVIRVPAALQDDGGVAVLAREGAPA